jgi:VWFA-related protein
MVYSGVLLEPSRTLLTAAAALCALVVTVETRGQDAVFTAGANLVSVPVTVTDGGGRFIPGLTQDDFLVYDDGKPQKIVTFDPGGPVSLVILVQGSLLWLSKQTSGPIDDVVVNRLKDGDDLFLKAFMDRSATVQTWTRDRDMFRQSLRELSTEGLGKYFGVRANGAALFDAMADAVRTAAEGGHRRKAVLVFVETATEEPPKSRLTVDKVQDMVRRTDVLVSALVVPHRLSALANRGEPRGLTKLTEEAGGRTDIVKDFKNLQDATTRVVEEIHQQYLLGYEVPANNRGRRHAIKVEVRTRDAKVRSRTAYIAR